MARSAWLEFALALAVVAVLGKSRKLRSTVLGTVLAVIIVGAFIAKLPIGRVVAERFETLNNVAADDSGQERLVGYKSVFRTALASPFGEGWRIESQDNKEIAIHDSTAAEVVLCTGWFGLAMLYGAIVAALFIMLKNVRRSDDKFAVVVCGLVLGLFAETIVNSLLGGSTDMGLWTCIGIGLSAAKHEEYRMS